MVSALERALEGSGARNHLCSVYETAQERYAVSIPFVRIGLERGEKCFYVVDEGTDQILRAALEAQGVDAERAVGTKALVVLTKAEAYLKNGVFDPERMFAFWREAAEKARSDVFSDFGRPVKRIGPCAAPPARARGRIRKHTQPKAPGYQFVCPVLIPTRIANPARALAFPGRRGKAAFQESTTTRRLHRAAKERKRELQQTRGKLREAQAALEQAKLAREPTSPKQADWAALHATLNPRGRDVMALVTSGLLNKEVASLLGLAELTCQDASPQGYAKDAGGVVRSAPSHR